MKQQQAERILKVIEDEINNEFFISDNPRKRWIELLEVVHGDNNEFVREFNSVEPVYKSSVNPYSSFTSETQKAYHRIIKSAIRETDKFNTKKKTPEPFTYWLIGIAIAGISLGILIGSSI